MKRKWSTGVFAGATIFLIIFAGVMFSQGASADQGREVFDTQKCLVCHSIAGRGGDVRLDGIGARLRPDDFRKRIKTPKEVKADSEMKAYPNLPERDINNLIAYLLTLK